MDNSELKKYLDSEREFHDRHAEGLRWDAAVSNSISYGKHPEADEYFIGLVGNVEGKRILDIGSGYGNCALFFAGKGALVTGIDLSQKIIEGCTIRSEKNRLKAEFMVMDATDLDFEDSSFDIVLSSRSIHHLPDIEKFYEQAHRVLRKGGYIVFAEPQKMNPFVEFGRKYIKNKEEDRTATEHPLVPDDLKKLKSVFGNMEKREFEFLEVASLVFKVIIRIPSLHVIFSSILKATDRLLWYFPPLRPLYWQVVVKAVKL